MQSIVTDIGRSVAMTSCKKLVFFNGHGGNSSLVSMMNRELRLAFGLHTFLAHPSLPADHGGGSHASELGMGIHGGHDETSLMLHLRPNLVDMTRAKRAIPEHLQSNHHVKFGGSVQFGWLSNDFDESGVIGDPGGANAEHGERSFENAVETFCEALEEIQVFRTRGG
jgi:creatinine amidohydrolase